MASVIEDVYNETVYLVNSLDAAEDDALEYERKNRWGLWLGGACLLLVTSVLFNQCSKVLKNIKGCVGGAFVALACVWSCAARVVCWVGGCCGPSPSGKYSRQREDC